MAYPQLYNDPVNDPRQQLRNRSAFIHWPPTYPVSLFEDERGVIGGDPESIPPPSDRVPAPPPLAMALAPPAPLPAAPSRGPGRVLLDGGTAMANNGQRTGYRTMIQGTGWNLGPNGRFYPVDMPQLPDPANFGAANRFEAQGEMERALLSAGLPQARVQAERDRGNAALMQAQAAVDSVRQRPDPVAEERRLFSEEGLTNAINLFLPGEEGYHPVNNARDWVNLAEKVETQLALAGLNDDPRDKQSFENTKAELYRLLKEAAPPDAFGLVDPQPGIRLFPVDRGLQATVEAYMKKYKVERGGRPDKQPSRVTPRPLMTGPYGVGAGRRFF